MFILIEEYQEETSTPYEYSGTEDTSSDSEEEKYIREICRTVQRYVLWKIIMID